MHFFSPTSGHLHISSTIKSCKVQPKRELRSSVWQLDIRLHLKILTKPEVKKSKRKYIFVIKKNDSLSFCSPKNHELIKFIEVKRSKKCTKKEYKNYDKRNSVITVMIIIALSEIYIAL